MNTKSKLKAISIGIAAIIMVSLLATVSVSASPGVDVTDCGIGDGNKVYFTIYSDAKADGYARLDVNGAYEERKKFSLKPGETRTLSFRLYRWSECEDVEVCVDSSCCNPIPTTPPTFTVTAWPSSTYYYIGSQVYIYYAVNKPCYARVTHLIQNSNIFWGGPRYVCAGTHTYSGTIWWPRGMRTVVVDAWTSSGEYAYAVTSYNVG